MGDTTDLRFSRKKISKKKLRMLHRELLFPRMIEERMLTLLRQGKISKWFSGIGQEAISVGAIAALRADEFVFPMHRNLGVFTSRKVPLDRLMAQWQGKMLGFTQGRDRSFHFGSLEHHVVGMISHLGPQLSLAGGIGLSHLLRQEGKVVLAFTGEGGTSEGDFHEALNVAAVWNLPVIFVIENNGYGLSTPTREQYACANLADRGKGFGMEAVTIDGNNVVEVFRTVDSYAKQLRQDPRPVLIECRTFRMRGHEEASGTKYVPQELMEAWSQRDPVSNFETWLLEEGILQLTDLNELKEELSEVITTAEQKAFSAPAVEADQEKEINQVFGTKSVSGLAPAPKGGDREIRFVDAIKEAMEQAMELDPTLVLMGQDIAEYGGVFKATDGLVEQYGARVRNTPLCESAIIGIGIGLTMRGHRAMVEMQFSDFVTCGFNQIVNNLAKLHYRWGHSPGVVVRMPCGGSVSAGPFHSQTMEAWFTHTPGLVVLYPSNAYDAKGLLLAALQSDQPVMFFEHKALYRSEQSAVPEDVYHIPFGKGRVVQAGRAASIITYGLGVRWALEVAEGLDVEVVDLRSLHPIDHDIIAQTVRKTGKALVLHEASLTGGFGGELAAWIGEHLFEHLDGPVVRVASLDTPIPFAKPLEDIFLAKSRLREKLVELINY